MFYLINLDANRIIAADEDYDALQKQGDEAKFDFHVVNEKDFAGCTLADLAKYFNNLPAVTVPIERFSDKGAGIRRINEAIEKGGVSTMTIKKPKKEGVAPKGRKPGWSTIELAAAGKADDLRFHQNNTRFKIFDIIKKSGSLERDALLTQGESLGINRGQVMNAVGKLIIRKLVEVK